MTRIVYVRHGESNTTVARRIGGPRTCTGLSSLGVVQAERLRDRWLASPEFAPDALFASHYPRARETAEVLSGAFGAMPVEIDDGFGEHDPGPDCDGMSYAEFVDRFGTSAWTDDPYAVTFPGGETLAAFQYRVGAAVRRLVDRFPEGTVLVACHGGVIDAVLRQALKAAPTGLFHINTLNTSITELERRQGNVWALLRYGDSAHLAGLPAATSVD